MKCSFCGNELEAGSNFCPNCGTILSIEENNETVDKAYDEPIDIYSNTKQDEEEYKAPEYVPPVLETEPIYDTPLESEDDDDDPFKEMHPDNYEEPTEEDDDDGDDDEYDDGEDMLVKSNKSKKGIAVISVLVIILVAVIAGGVYAVKSNFEIPFLGNIQSVIAAVKDEFFKPTDNDVSEPSDDVSKEDPTEEDNTTEEEPSEDDTSDEDTTDEDTSEEDTTKEDMTQEPSTEPSESEEESDNIVSASNPTQTTEPSTAPTTTAPTTTAPTTTAPTTTAPTTTVPKTTVPATTAPRVPSTTAKPTVPQTTAPANKLKKPAKTISKFTVYATSDGVSLRYTPSSSSARILYLSVGADLVVSGEENGFYYVYCSRYSVYGWVSKSYTSSTRPTAQTEQKVSGVVTPDTAGSGKTMYVNTTDGLRLRKGPGTNYDVIRMISNGYPVVVKGTSSSAPGWVYVTDTTHGVSGWVSSAFLK